MKIPQGYKLTEQGIIPEDWEIKDFAQIFDIYPNNTYPRDCMNEFQGRLRNIHYGDILIKYPTILDAKKCRIPFLNKNVKIKSHKIIQSGDVIIADTAEDETVGKCVEIKNAENLAIVAGLHTFFCHPKQLYASGWLGYFINSSQYHNQLLPYITGIKVSSISRNSIQETKLLAPSIAEQNAIAKTLSDVDALIAALDKKIAKKRLIKQGAMQRLLTGKERLAGFHTPWQQKRLKDIAELYQPKTIAQDRFNTHGYKVYGANGIIGKYHQYNHETDQVLITCRGSSCGTINYSIGFCWITGNAMVINMDNHDEVDKRFIFYSLYSQDLADLITGSGQPQIIRQSLLEYIIKIPTSISEQQAIATILSDMDKEIANLETRRDKYKLIKSGMMQKLLTGQIRLIKPQAKVIPLAPQMPATKEIPVDAHIVAGHIVYKSHQSRGWGRTKLQKSLHLIGYIMQLNLGNEYIRNTAGPDDQRMMNYIDQKFKQFRHVNIIKEKLQDGRTHYSYIPTALIQDIEIAYERYPQDVREQIDALLDKLNSMDLTGAEILSTLYAVWNNRIIKGEQITDDLLISDFYAWSEHKAEFEEARVRKELDYIRIQNIIPTGWGQYIDKK